MSFLLVLAQRIALGLLLIGALLFAVAFFRGAYILDQRLRSELPPSTDDRLTHP